MTQLNKIYLYFEFEFVQKILYYYRSLYPSLHLDLCLTNIVFKILQINLYLILLKIVLMYDIYRQNTIKNIKKNMLYVYHKKYNAVVLTNGSSYSKCIVKKYIYFPELRNSLVHNRMLKQSDSCVVCDGLCWFGGLN